MKKILLFTFISPLLFAQDYLPMNKEGNVWRLVMTVYSGIADECQNLPQKNVNYNISLGNIVTFENKEYREVYRQHEFNSLESFQKSALCDLKAEGGFFLGYLNESNYNDKVLVGYLRDDVSTKKVYYKSLDTTEIQLHDFNAEIVDPMIDPYEVSLVEINNAQYFNIDTKEFVYKAIATNFTQFVYEGIGDIKSDFVYQNANAIDGIQTYLLAFSADQGNTFYKKDNELLKVTDLHKSLKYQLKQNPVKQFLELNTIQDIRELLIVDVTGRTVLKVDNNQKFKVDVSSLSLGKYYLIINTNQKQEVVSFLKK